MSKFIRKSLAPFLLLLSTSGFSDYEKLTDEFAPHFEARAIGTAVSSDGWEVVSRGCKLAIRGKCHIREEIKAEGGVSITAHNETDGDIYKLNIFDPLTGAIKRGFSSNMYFQFHYDGWTRAKKFENGMEIDRPWGLIHPTGRVSVWLKGIPGENFSLHFELHADPGHGDRPNNFIAKVGEREFKKILAEHVKQLLNAPNLVIH